ncbi:hypothetical protein J2Z57_002150 [Formosa algae]|uniref:Uncharacterized protein n=1 Tax=Formosa algae TaxID=225843 RepID=A0A9X0YK58_9FLAO|nr:hypothetical protein [Formosa algae]MDQ0335699.1 hypothetical protein [Formosa algae]
MFIKVFIEKLSYPYNKAYDIEFSLFFNIKEGGFLYIIKY